MNPELRYFIDYCFLSNMQGEEMLNEMSEAYCHIFMDQKIQRGEN